MEVARANGPERPWLILNVSQMKTLMPLILPLLICGCATSKRPPSGIAEPFVVEGVNISDGVSREEARDIAFRYFDEFHGSCGGLDFAKETSAAWYFRAVVGFAADPMPDIVVQKNGSKVLQEGSPDAFYKDGAWRYRGRNFFNEEGRG